MEVGIYVSLGKCILSSIEKKKNVQEHTVSFSQHMAMICWGTCPSLFPRENMSSVEQQYIVCVFSVPVHAFLQVCVQCVVPEGERALVQLSGSDFDLTRPLFVHMKLNKPRPSHCGHAQAVASPPACVCV